MFFTTRTQLVQLKTQPLLKKIWGQELDFFLKEIFNLKNKNFILSLYEKSFFELSLNLKLKMIYFSLLKFFNYPTEYIFKKTFFFEDTFFINRHVLIPRPETEYLVSLITQRFKESPQSPKNILDIGCGSGIIAISLKKKFPQARVVAIDISKMALRVAKKNAQFILKNSSAIDFILSDIFSKMTQILLRENPFDLIVANPPYVADLEKKYLSPSTLRYEPQRALFAGQEGLGFFLKLKEPIKHWLNPRGKVYLEMGFKQSRTVLETFSFLKNKKIINDLQGKKRFFYAER